MDSNHPLPDGASTVAEPAAPAAPGEAIVQLLRDSDQPLTVAEIKKRYPQSKKPSDQKLRQAVETLLLSSQIFECPPKGKSTRYWIRDEEQLIREKILELTRHKAWTKMTLDKELVKVIPKGTTPAWRTKLLDRMRKEELLYEHPPVRGTAFLLAASPVNPRQYLTPTMLKQLSAAWKKLEKVGVSVDQVLLIVREQLAPNSVPGQEAGSEATTSPTDLSLTSALGNSSVKEVVGSAPTLAPSAPATAVSLPDLEINDLIFKGMLDLEANAAEGAMVSTSELRRWMPPEYQHQDTFDKAILQLAQEDRIYLYKDNDPNLVSEQERNEMVRDEQGNYYIYMAQRK